MSLQSERTFAIFHGTNQWSLMPLITRRLSPSIIMLLMPRLKALAWTGWSSWLQMRILAAATYSWTEPSYYWGVRARSSLLVDASTEPHSTDSDSTRFSPSSGHRNSGQHNRCGKGRGGSGSGRRGGHNNNNNLDIYSVSPSWPPWGPWQHPPSWSLGGSVPWVVPPCPYPTGLWYRPFIPGRSQQAGVLGPRPSRQAFTTQVASPETYEATLLILRLSLLILRPRCLLYLSLLRKMVSMWSLVPPPTWHPNKVLYLLILIWALNIISLLTMVILFQFVALDSTNYPPFFPPCPLKMSFMHPSLSKIWSLFVSLQLITLCLLNWIHFFLWRTSNEDTSYELQ